MHGNFIIDFVFLCAYGMDHIPYSKLFPIRSPLIVSSLIHGMIVLVSTQRRSVYSCDAELQTYQ